MLSRLRGIFAFGLWDTERRELLIARDALGVKPLYYAHYAEHFSFASQPKAILGDPAFDARISPTAMRDFLAYGYVPRDRAIFANMAKLPAAHYGIYRDGRLSIARYWEPDCRPLSGDANDCAWQLRDALVDAVRTQLVADVPLGCFLSGGIDSSLLVALARGTGIPLKTFTLGFDDAASDERIYARRVARHFNTEHFEHVLDAGQALAGLESLTEHFDEPFDPNGPLPFMQVARMARQHSTVVALGGDGADELFLGYLRYDDFDAPPWASAGLSRSGWRALRKGGLCASRRASPTELSRYFAYEGCLDDQAQALLLDSKFRDRIEDQAIDLMRPWFSSDIPAVCTARAIDMNLYLVDHILCKVDRAAMASGVEARVPFLDPAVVDLALRIPAQLHYASGERKALFKQIARQFLPVHSVSVRKKGFSSPLSLWQNNAFLGLFHSRLDRGRLLDQGVLRDDWARGLAQITAADAARGMRARWLLLTAELWARRWLDRDAVAAAA